MNTEPIANHCPKCHAPLPANAPRGLCPKCLLAAVSTPTEAGQPADRNPPPSIEEVAASFPQLQILEIIGHGGMGVVYKARQPRLDRLVALKLLPQSLAADAAFAERFNREARVLARLNHPNIVTVHDFGQSGGFFYLLMEFVDGVNLRQAMQAGRFTPQQAMMLVPKICEALQFAHDEGILHRDIKPENILLDTRGRVKIADFGIAKLLGEARENLTLTAIGQAVGTPHYMAPEQLEHPQDVDQRADIYSLGVVFYEMLTGELPIGRFAPPSQKSSVDARVDEVVFHALEKEREKRFRSAGEVKTSVEAITAHPAGSPTETVSVATPAKPSPGAAVPAPRALCYFSTPRRMRDCFPSAAARIFTCKGELQLDTENLAFTSHGQKTITIPLKDIEDLSVGQFQIWLTLLRIRYVRISFLSVSFRQQGLLRCVHLTPVEPRTTSPGEINDCVSRWFERVRRAASQCTGTMPHASDTTSLSVSAERAWDRRGLPLIFGCALPALVLMVAGLFPEYTVAAPIFSLALVVFTLLVIALLWFVGGYLRAHSALWDGDLDAVTSDDPPALEPAGADGAGFGAGRRPRARWRNVFHVGLVTAAIVAVLLAGLWGFRGWFFPSGHRTWSGSRPATDFGPPLVLDTMPPLPFAGTTEPTNQLRWTFKCLVPPQHIAHLLFVYWSNGVPVVEIGGSTYCKVGNSSLVQDMYVTCSPVPDPLFQDPTNTVRWNACWWGQVTSFLRVPSGPAYRRVEPPATLLVYSGHQGILRLMDYVTPEGKPRGGQAGVELRLFLEPMKEALVQTDPLEVAGTNYIAGRGPYWTPDQWLAAIKQWPADR